MLRASDCCRAVVTVICLLQDCSHTDLMCLRLLQDLNREIGELQSLVGEERLKAEQTASIMEDMKARHAQAAQVCTYSLTHSLAHSFCALQSGV